MFPARFIFISDQGRVYSSTDEPTADDIAYADVGMLTIFRLADGCYYGRGGRWEPIQGRVLRPNVGDTCLVSEDALSHCAQRDEFDPVASLVEPLLTLNSELHAVSSAPRSTGMQSAGRKAQ